MNSNFGGYLHAKVKMSVSLWIAISWTIKKKIGAQIVTISASVISWTCRQTLEMKMHWNKASVQLITSVQVEVSLNYPSVLQDNKKFKQSVYWTVKIFSVIFSVMPQDMTPFRKSLCFIYWRLKQMELENEWSLILEYIFLL